MSRVPLFDSDVVPRPWSSLERLTMLGASMTRHMEHMEHSVVFFPSFWPGSKGNMCWSLNLRGKSKCQNFAKCFAFMFPAWLVRRQRKRWRRALIWSFRHVLCEHQALRASNCEIQCSNCRLKSFRWPGNWVWWPEERVLWPRNHVAKTKWL